MPRVLRRSPPDVAGLRIVLAEDDSSLRELIAMALRQDGFDVLELADGDALAAALSAVAANELEVCMVITDLRMPGRSGLAALPVLAAAPHAPPVILITAFGEPATEAAAMPLGVVGDMNKPFEIDDLRTLVWYVARRGLG